MSLDSVSEGLLILTPVIILLVVGAVIALRSGVHDLGTGRDTCKSQEIFRACFCVWPATLSSCWPSNP